MAGKSAHPLGDSRSPLVVKALAEICLRCPSDSKTLVVPSYLYGRQLLETLVRHAGGWLNLRLATPVSLALDCCASTISEKGMAFAADIALEAIFTDVYFEEKKDYFPAEAGPGLVAAVQKAIGELRLAGIQPADLTRINSIARDKAKDLSTLMAAYEQSLARHNYLDEAGLYRLAAGSPSLDGEMVILPESLRVNSLARRFLESCAGERAVVIAEDPVVGLNIPARRWTVPRKKPVGPLSFLFEPDANPFAKPEIEMFSAVGERNEAREVVRRILSAKIPFDRVEIVATDYGTYSRILDDLQGEIEGLQFTFAGGLPQQRSRPARALASFAAWLRDDFPDSILRHLFMAGDLRTPDGVGGRQAAGILRQAMIGWGIARYSERLDAHCRTIQAEVEKEEDADRVAELEERLARAKAVSDSVRSIVALVPPDDSPLNLYLDAAAGFLKGHVGASSESDGQVMAQILKGLDLLSRHAHRAVDRKDVAYHLESVIRSVRVNVSGPRPGHVHVTGLHGAGFSGRSVNFVLGLDEGRFPGGAIQDPVLLDAERSMLSPDLLYAAHKSQDKTYQFAEYFARVRGNVTLSFSAFDLSDNRRSFPSSVLLQAFRLFTGVPDADYKALQAALGTPVGFLDGGFPVSRGDWWLSQLSSERILLDAQDSVLKAYPHLARGRVAEEAHREPIATPHDGRLAPDKAFDPRSDGSRSISPSSLEPYARCPRRYFFHTVMRIRPPEELAYEPGQWLDPRNRGALLHEFYQRFLGYLAGQRVRRDPARHQDLASRMLNEVIEEWKVLIPPPSASVFEFEREGLQRSLSVFLREEVGRRSPGFPAYFEASFGMGASSEISLPEPVEVRLPGGGSFKASGRVDRIDRLDGGVGWDVWDYKTGGTYGYRAKGYVAGGTQLQHVIYAITTEQMLRKAGEKSPRVVSSGYIFPTEKGEGKRFPRPTSRIADGLKTIEDLFNRMADGVFLATADGCKFCDYDSVCAADREARWKALLELGDASAISMEEIRGRD